MNARQGAILLTALTLTAGSAAASRPHFQTWHGNDYWALGQADLDVVDGELEIGRLGTSGQDGVRVGIGGAEGMSLSVADAFGPDTAPIGSFHTLSREYLDEAGNVVAKSSLTSELMPGFVEIRADLQSDRRRTIVVFNDGVPVAEMPPHSGAWDLQIEGDLPADTSCEPWDCDGYLYCWDDNCIDTNDFTTGSGGEDSAFTPVRSARDRDIVLPDGRRVVGDAFLIRPEVEAPMGVDQEIRLIASGVPEIRLTDSALLQFGLRRHRAVGQATFSATHTEIILGNIGATGDDGIEIEGRVGVPALGEPTHVERRLQVEIDPLQMGSRSHVELSVDGPCAGDAPAKLGHVELQERDGSVFVDADFSAVGATAARVEVRSGGMVVGAVELGFGQVAEIVGLPAIAQTEHQADGTVELGWTFAEPMTMVLANGEVYTGENLAISSVGPALSCAGVGTGRILLGSFEKDLVIEREVAEALATVSADAAPAGSVEIPASGGSFQIDVSIRNNLDVTQTVEAWTVVILPDSSVIEPVIGPATLTLAPFQELTPTLTQPVPGSVAAGDYVYELRVGSFPGTVLDAAAVTFTKLP